MKWTDHIEWMWLSLPVSPALSRCKPFLVPANDWHWPSCPLSFHMTKCEASARVKLSCVLESNQRTLKTVNVIESFSCLNTYTFKAVTKDLPDNRTELYKPSWFTVFSIVLNVHKASRCPCMFCLFRKTKWQMQHEEIAVMQRQQNDSRQRRLCCLQSCRSDCMWML